MIRTDAYLLPLTYRRSFHPPQIAVLYSVPLNSRGTAAYASQCGGAGANASVSELSNLQGAELLCSVAVLPRDRNQTQAESGKTQYSSPRGTSKALIGPPIIAGIVIGALEV